MDTVTFAERKYPTIYDYEEAKRLNASTIVDEIKGKSNLVFDAAVGTTEGYRFTFDRVLEKKNTARAMAFDEGYQAAKDGRSEEIASETMRVGDARTFDELVSDGVSDGGLAAREIAIKNMASSIIKLKGDSLLYGGQLNGTSVNPKEIPGMVSYLSKISDYNKMISVYEEGQYAPFKGENGLVFDNQDGSDATDSSATEAAKSDKVWASIFGIAWGTNGVFTTYPRYHKRGSGAYNFMIHAGNPNSYTDKYDGIEKTNWDDWYTADAFFGLGVRNRFCLSGLRNIYLGHKKKADREDEAYRIRQNLIAMKRFFDMGETGLSMRFYTSPYVINLVEEFQKNQVTLIGHTPDENSGAYGKLNDGRLVVAEGIELVADFAFKTSEAFVSEKESWT